MLYPGCSNLSYRLLALPILFQTAAQWLIQNAVIITSLGATIAIAREVAIHFYADLHLQQLGKPLKVTFSVTDQLAKEHRVPPILLPVHMVPEKK
jgi:hypothetical protein